MVHRRSNEKLAFLSRAAQRAHNGNHHRAHQWRRSAPCAAPLVRSLSANDSLFKGTIPERLQVLDRPAQSFRHRSRRKLERSHDHGGCETSPSHVLTMDSITRVPFTFSRSRNKLEPSCDPRRCEASLSHVFTMHSTDCVLSNVLHIVPTQSSSPASRRKDRRDKAKETERNGPGP